MGHSYEYEHLGQDIPETKVVTPRTLRVSGDVEVRPWPPLPYDFEEMVAANQPRSIWQRIRDAFGMSW